MIGSIPRLASTDFLPSNRPFLRIEAIHELMDLCNAGRRLFHCWAARARSGPLFGEAFLGHYRNPVTAAEEVGIGEHPILSCALETGKSLCVPSGVHKWKFVQT